MPGIDRTASPAAGLVCLAGASGAGKDTAAGHLARRHGFRRVAIADPLKQSAQRLFGLSREQLWGADRNVVDLRYGLAPRELYQRLGSACRERDPEVWIRAFRNTVEELRQDAGAVVCTDLRTMDELRVAREMGAVVWRVERTGAGAPGRMGQDRTEMELARTDRDAFDAILPNDGSVEDLYAAVDTALVDAWASHDGRAE